MAKPFSIQSPEDIAMQYGGNKQKIAQAMQLGVVDPTAGVLAGMFIDRMRSAQVQEQAPQTTVAQQVMGGVQPAPQSVPTGGLGATSQAAPPMAPGMAAPAPQAPPGMAEGGIVGLDIPDTMFDEPSNGGFDDGYAGGGLVAFADGGDVDLNAFRRAIIAQESGGRFGVPNMEGSGAMGIGQIMPDTARALAKRLGLPYRPDLLAGKDKASQQYQMALTNAATKEAWDYGKGDVGKASAYYFAGPDQSKWGPKTRRYQSDVARRLGSQADGAPAAGLGGLKPPTDTLESLYPAALKEAEDYYAKNMPERKNEGLGLLTKAARETLDPANMKKRKDEDKWMMLAEIGFNMASSNSPYLLQAASAAAAAALPGARAAKKEREEAKREAIRDLANAEDITYKQAAEKANYIRDVAKTKLDLKDRDLTRTQDWAKFVLGEQGDTERARIAARGQLDVANVYADADRSKAANGPTIAQLNDQSSQQGTRVAKALEDMQAAEDSGNYAQFQAAVTNYRNALTAYNSVAKALGMSGMVSVPMSQFPTMNAEFQKRRAAAGAQQGAPAGSQKATPAGVTQAEWNAMTPQERALFQ